MAIPAEDIFRTLPPEERAAIEKRSAALLAECLNRPSPDLSSLSEKVRSKSARGARRTRKPPA